MPEPERAGRDGGRDQGVPLSERALLEELYEEAPCGYLSTRADGTITRTNRTFEQWTGHERQELIGRRFGDLLSAGGRIYHETHYAPLLRMQGEVREIAFELVRADGTQLPVLVNSVRRGEEIRTTVFDATDRRHYERELVAERRRAEALQRQATLVAAVSRSLEEVNGLSARAQRLAEAIVPEVAQAAIVLAGDPPTLLGAAGDGSGDQRLRAAVDEASRTQAPQIADGGPVAAVPMRLGRRLVGVLGVSRARTVDGIAASELPLLEALADRGALALENGRLFEHQREVAHTLQRAMLPGELPRHPRCAIGAHYTPGVETLEVGGDWYDAFLLGDDELALVVGDVVGRGLQAAAMMGQLRSAVRALAGARLGPAGVLQHLDTFVEGAGLARGVTVAYAELDLCSGALRYACAGHPPPVMATRSGPPELLWGGRSAPLGAYIGAAVRAEASVELPRGARLLLYTDGLVERRDRSLDTGLELLMKAFAEEDGTVADRIGDALTGRLLDGAEAGDDVCLLALAFGSEAPFELSLPAEAGRLRSLRAELGTWLDARGIAGSDRDALILACSEAAANAIEHGYRDGDGPVRIVADTAAGEVTVEVGDRGSWRAPRAGRGSRGRGLQIVETLMDDVVMDRGSGTRVTMRRRLRETGYP